MHIFEEKDQIVGGVAEFEKDFIKERVIAGLAKARRKGKRLGRPLVSQEVYEKAKELRRQRLSFRKIGREFDVDEGTIRKRIKLKNLPKMNLFFFY